LTAGAANATTIAIYRVARFGVLLPVPSSSIGFRNVASKTDGFEVYRPNILNKPENTI